MTRPPLTDVHLARRLERAEALGNAAFVEARAAREPAVGATWRDVGGAYAMFDGPDSPITQTFGLGLFSPPTDAQLGELEAFFAGRGAPTHHETCPLADPALLALLGDRGYRAVEQSAVLHRAPPLAGAIRSASAELTARVIEPGEERMWAATAAAGWGAESPELGAFMEAFGMLTAHARGVTCFIAEHGATPVAAAAMAIHEGVALLAGASTRAEWRRRGAQGALLAARLDHAAAAGCDLAMMAALPGSTSQQNAERQGFRIAYTRTKWMKRRA